MSLVVFIKIHFRQHDECQDYASMFTRAKAIRQTFLKFTCKPILIVLNLVFPCLPHNFTPSFVIPLFPLLIPPGLAGHISTHQLYWKFKIPVSLRSCTPATPKKTTEFAFENGAFPIPMDDHHSSIKIAFKKGYIAHFLDAPKYHIVGDLSH